jgi:Phosphate-selective porin O and P
VTPTRALTSTLALAVISHATALAPTAALAREAPLAEADAVPTSESAPVETPPDERNFREILRFDVGPLSLSPVVLLQAQAIPYIGADTYLQAGDPAERGGFRMRRARFGFAGKLYHRVPFCITAEFSSDDQGTARLHDAWFGYDRFTPIQIFVGTRDVPFSRSALSGAGNTALIERPLAVRAMAPFHQLGANAEGRFFHGAFGYALGVYNGLSRSDQFFQGYTENAALRGNRWGGLTYAARVETTPVGSPDLAIQDLHHDKFRISAAANGFYSNGGTRNILALGGDLLLHIRGLHILGEFLMNRTDPRAEPTQPATLFTTVQSLAAVGEVGYTAIPHSLGVTTRLEWIDPNTAVTDEGDSWILAVGVSAHFIRDLLKAQIDLTHRQEIHGRPLANDGLVLQLQMNL